MPATGVSALSEFRDVLADVKSIGAWMVKGALIAPLADLIIDIGPQWPKGADLIIPIIEILVLIYLFQVWQGKPKWFYVRKMRISLAVVISTFVLYLVMLVFLTFSPPWERTRFAKGFVLTPLATIGVEAGIAPEDILRRNNWDSASVWEPWSIKVVQIISLLLWLGLFTALSAYVGGFVMAQRRQRRRAQT